MGCSSKQKGGGVFDVFCPLCNLPFYSPFEGQKIPSDDDEGDDLYDLRNTDLKWLSDVLGVDDNTNTVMELEGDDRYGQFPIKSGKDKGELFGLRDSIAVQAGTRKKEYYKGFGAAFHNDCFKYISQKSGRPISYQLGVDIEQKIEDYFKAHPKTRRDDDYQQQSYDFQGALEDHDPDYFVSPLEPDGKHVQQMLSDFIPRIKTPSPKKNKTPSPPRPVQAEAEAKVVAEVQEINQKKKKGAASGATATVDNNCASQKDKVICIKKKCVWGKTNRCSKKRSTKKQPKTKSKTTAKSSANTHACPSHKDKNECVKNNCVWGKTNRCSKKRVTK
jgi:hypothetical protein